jgi:hypothetical protein
LFGTLNLNGVPFDQVAKGGITLPDPAARSAWKKPEELFTAFKQAIPRFDSQGAGIFKK